MTSPQETTPDELATSQAQAAQPDEDLIEFVPESPPRRRKALKPKRVSTMTLKELHEEEARVREVILQFTIKSSAKLRQMSQDYAAAPPPFFRSYFLPQVIREAMQEQERREAALKLCNITEWQPEEPVWVPDEEEK